MRDTGRLNNAEAAELYGTNVSPLGMTREELRAGFIRVMGTCYGADHYFARLDAQFVHGNFKFALHGLPYWEGRRGAWLKRCFFNYVRFAVIASRLLLLQDKAFRSRYGRQLLSVLQTRWREPHILFVYALKVTFHYHFAAIANALRNADGTRGAMPTAGRSFSRIQSRAKEKAAV